MRPLKNIIFEVYPVWGCRISPKLWLISRWSGAKVLARNSTSEV